MNLKSVGDPNPEMANPHAVHVISSGLIWSNLLVNKVSNYTKSLGNLLEISENDYKTLSKSKVEILSVNLLFKSFSKLKKKLFVPACTW